MEQSTFLSEEHPANPSQSQESEAAWVMGAVTSPLSILGWLTENGPNGWFGRTSPASSAAHKEKTSDAFSLDLFDGPSQPQTEDGLTEVLLPPDLSMAPTGWHGEFLTLSTLEFHSDADACLLSGILETGDLPQRFFLSATACKGILRRAEKRGKILPDALQFALSQVIEKAA